MIRSAGFGPRLVREYNELNILRYIKNEGPISRADLAKRYKISKAAVSEIIANLLTQQYIIETGTGNSTSLGGRKPILLEFNPRSGYVIAIEIKRNYARVALSDLDANILKNTIIDFPRATSLKPIIKMIFDVIDGYLQIKWVKTAKPVGIGLAIPGLINYHRGKIQESDTLKEWQGYPLKKAFEDHYDIETIIENDVKAMSLGECRFGGGKDINNLIYLWIGDGLGAGIIINGELYRGVSAAAGEIGYNEPGSFIREADDFKLLYHGQKDFGDLLSEIELLKSAEKIFARTGFPYEITVDNILKAANEGHEQVKELLAEYGNLVGILCTNLVNTLNPEAIIIGGHALHQCKVLMKTAKERVRDSILKTPSKAVQIKSATLRDNAAILGSIALILEDLFYIERLNIRRYVNVFGYDR